MKKLLLFITVLFVATRLIAQTNSSPVRLALIVESREATTVGDVLTAELSKNDGIYLLERTEIEKVYREQGLSAVNRDYLKLGQILGADGLWLFEINKTTQQTNLTARLIAVKPGVVLLEENFTWPLTGVTEWASSVANHLNPILPKLTVLVKDAIPISVVNLRSAVQSTESLEAERQLKLLTIQRLSRERQLFVLERQRMQLLSEEKELKADESAFWNGSYLLEGVVDQNGYSKETITINARLTPPKGGTAIPIEVSGSRTNFAAVINQLAIKVNEALKVASTVKEWNAADEAQQYFEEAKWALKWGVLPEAQAAADSAWALAKRDLECAIVRIKSYERAAVPVTISEEGVIDRSIIDSSDESDRQATIKQIKSIFATHSGAVFAFGVHGIDYVPIDNLPDAKSLGRVTHALELYREFSQTLPEGEPKVDSAWYALGVESLTSAAQVLQNYYLVPKSQGDVVDKLSELRATARSVAGWISKSPSVHDSYFAVDPNADNAMRALIYSPNIYRCEANWGCFWQEKPEDCIALYRDLLSSPAFSYFAEGFGSSAEISYSRGLERPRLVAWNEADRKRVSVVWDNFVRELNDSTNQLLRGTGGAFNELIAAGANEGEMLAQYDEYWRAIQSAKRNVMTGGKQIEYLKANDTGDINSLVGDFLVTESTKNQALEIKPLLATYWDNLIAQMGTKSGVAKVNLEYAINYVEGAQAKVDRLLNKAQVNVTANSAVLLQPVTAKSELTQKTNPVSAARPIVVTKIPEATVEIATNVITVNKFLEIPLASLPGDKISAVTITAHHWLEGKLLLDFQYRAFIYSFDEKGDWKGTDNPTLSAIAILDPATEHWDVISSPETGLAGRNDLYHRSTLLRGELFTSTGGQIKKYDFQKRHWQDLAVSIGEHCELFVVNDRLYAVNGNMIFEIIDGGKATHILASTRRNPAMSALDKLDNLGTPTLFEGPNHSLRAIIGNSIHVWDEKNWQKESHPNFSGQQEVFDDAILFRSSSEALWAGPQIVWILQKKQSIPQLGLYRDREAVSWIDGGRKPSVPPQNPLWKLPPKLLLANLAVAWHQADLYLLADHSEVHKIANEHQEVVQEKVVGKDGYNAALLCFSRELPLPQQILLKFDAPEGCPPVKPLAWMLFTTNLLFCGLEKPNHVTRFMPNGADVVGIGYKAGVWVMPVAQLEVAIAEQKQIQSAQMAQEEAQTIAETERVQKEKEQARINLPAKYDRNHNGIIESDEKEEAWDDPVFVESELNAIDANYNGRLDFEELVYFDSNKNKILETKEQAGIDIAQHLLLQKLLKKFDINGDGMLGRSEYNDLWLANPAVNRFPNSYIPFPDNNRDGQIDSAELESSLKQQSSNALRPQRGSPAYFKQMRPDSSRPIDPQQLFKFLLEAYWQNPDSFIIPAPNRVPPDTESNTNGIPSGKTQ